MFSLAANPGPVWSYLDGAGNVLSQASKPGEGRKVINSWSNGNGYPTYSAVGQNRTGNPNQPPDYWPARALLMDGQSVGAIVRFTAPIAGSYKISGSFTGINDTCAGVHPVSVVVNGACMWSALITGFDAQAKFHLSQSLAVGDIVDFSNGYAGDPDCLATGLIVTLIGP
jgi:hypothetical protein